MCTGSRDKTIIAWYFEDMTILYTINELASHVVTLALSANNSFLIFGMPIVYYFFNHIIKTQSTLYFFNDMEADGSMHLLL